MPTLLSAFSSVVLFVLCVMCSCVRSDAQGVPTPAQIITDGDWIVEREGGAKKEGDKFVMRFEAKHFRTHSEREKLDSLDRPTGKWWIEKGLIKTERFIDKWSNTITVRDKNTFSMISEGRGKFKGKRLPPIPPAPPPAVQPAPENK